MKKCLVIEGYSTAFVWEQFRTRDNGDGVGTTQGVPTAALWEVGMCKAALLLLFLMDAKLMHI